MPKKPTTTATTTATVVKKKKSGKKTSTVDHRTDQVASRTLRQRGNNVRSLVEQARDFLDEALTQVGDRLMTTNLLTFLLLADQDAFDTPFHAPLWIKKLDKFKDKLEALHQKLREIDEIPSHKTKAINKASAAYATASTALCTKMNATMAEMQISIRQCKEAFYDEGTMRTCLATVNDRGEMVPISQIPDSSRRIRARDFICSKPTSKQFKAFRALMDLQFETPLIYFFARATKVLKFCNVILRKADDDEFDLATSPELVDFVLTFKKLMFLHVDLDNTDNDCPVNLPDEQRANVLGMVPVLESFLPDRSQVSEDWALNWESSSK